MAANNEEDDLAKDLDPILDFYSEPQGDTIDPEKAQEFLAKFEQLKVQIIGPLMEQVGKYLEKKGHSYSIKDAASIYDANPSITMEIYPRTATNVPIQEHEFPVITFIAESDIQMIGIEVRDGMPGRPGLIRGHTTELDSLSKEYVQNQIITMLRMNFVTRDSKTRWLLVFRPLL